MAAIDSFSDLGSCLILYSRLSAEDLSGCFSKYVSLTGRRCRVIYLAPLPELCLEIRRRGSFVIPQYNELS